MKDKRKTIRKTKVTKSKILELRLRGEYGKDIAKRVSEKGQQFIADRQDKEDFTEVAAKCNKCKYIVARFKHSNKAKDLRFRNFDIEYYYKADKGIWKGCMGINIDRKTKISFECCCGNDDRDVNSSEAIAPNIGFKLLEK